MYEWRRKPPHTVEYGAPTTAKLNPQVRVDAYFVFVTDHAYFRPHAGLSERLVGGEVALHVFKDNVLRQAVVALRVVARFLLRIAALALDVSCRTVAVLGKELLVCSYNIVV